MTTPLRALIVDDEPPARRWLRELLSAHPGISVVGEAGDVPTARECVASLAPDVVFLDVQMQPGSGFEVLPVLPATTRIVFVTAYDVYAVRAFDANALDYLLKPVHPDRLAETVRRLNVPSVGTPAPASTDRLGLADLVPLRDGGKLRMVAVSEIAAIQAEAAYTRVLLAGLPAMLVLRPIGEWESVLPSPPFSRIDRSLLVNLSRVRALEARSRDESHLGLDSVPEPLVLGRTASQRLRNLLSSGGKMNLLPLVPGVPCS